MPNWLLAFLSHDAAGLAFAAMMLLAGLYLLVKRRRAVEGSRLKGRLGLFAAIPFFAAGGLLLLGSIVHLTQAAKVRVDFPPPGKFVEVDGTRIHLVAEGEKSDAPTLVWFAGGHVGGFALQHLHRRMRGNFRSVLIDRPGTGWSDVGSFPRTTAKEVEEMWGALDSAGERGPYILIGHSLGGLLAANMARRRPDQVQSLVLLDATPPDTIIYGPKLSGLSDMRRDAFLTGFLRLFAIDYQKLAGMPAVPSKLDKQVNRELGRARLAMKAAESTSGSALASYSIFGEVSPAGLAAVAWETVVYDGELSPMPVYLVAPSDLAEFGSLPEAASAEKREADRMRKFFAATRERYMAVSNNSHRIVVPKGNGHNFPYEVPEFVVAAVNQAAKP
jgi:pimeloyl-ACP methyl ester carboxylesterase